jgi:hypothetical protein
MAELLARLSADVPPVGGLPDAEQAGRAVLTALDAAAAAAPLPRVATLAIVAGTASYALPADLVRVRRLDGLPHQGPVLVGGQGLIPTNSAAPPQETLTVANGLLTIHPTPAYSLGRLLHYDAGFVPDATGQLAALSDAHSRAVSMLAASEVLKLQAAWAARQAWQYQIGDERVSKEKLAAALREQAEQRERDGRTLLATLTSGGDGGRVAPYGTRARYPL